MKATVFALFAGVLTFLSIPFDGHAQSADVLRKRFLEFKARAEKGEALAQNNLGICYATGQGVERDEKEALNWIRKAADQNFPEALFNLGVAYETGQGVDPDVTTARKWYRKAAELNHAGAQNNLGIFYANGQSVKEDVVEAYSWYSLAARTNQDAAKNRGILAKTMSPQQLADAEKRIKELRSIIDGKRGLSR